MLLLIYLCIPGIFADTIVWQDNGYKMKIVNGVLKSVTNIRHNSDNLVIDNSFTAIDWRAFNDVGNIKGLTVISHNALKILPPLVFLPLKKLRRLYLAGNMKISSTKNAFIGLEKLRLLDVTGVLHEDSHKDNLNGIFQSTCVVSGSEHLRVPQNNSRTNQEPYRLLCMNEEGIVKSLRSINNLEKLRISVKECDKVDLIDNFEFETETCNLGDKGITGFEKGWYNVTGFVQVLNLEKNNITDISPAMLNDLPPSIRMVHLFKNKLNILKSGIIKNKNLWGLYLSNNFITEIQDNALDPKVNTALEDLVLSFNNLTNNKFVETLPRSIMKLRIDNNKIDRLYSNAFVNMTKLKDLDLSGNKLVTLAKNAFNGLQNLKDFDIDRNNLTNLTVEAFRGLPAEFIPMDLLK